MARRLGLASQTFRCDYGLRRRDLLEALFQGSRGGSGLGRMAQELAIAPSSVPRQLERLGRHCLLFHETLRPHAAGSAPPPRALGRLPARTSPPDVARGIVPRRL